MVPEEGDHLAMLPEVHYRLEHPTAVGAPADVVAEKDEGVGWAWTNLPEKTGEATGMPVDVANRNCAGHRQASPGRVHSGSNSPGFVNPHLRNSVLVKPPDGLDTITKEQTVVIGVVCQCEKSPPIGVPIRQGI